MGQRDFRTQIGARQIHVEDIQPTRIIRIVHGGPARHAGVIDQNINVSPLVNHGRHDSLHLVTLGHVGRYAHGAAATLPDPGNRFLKEFRTPPAHGNADSLIRQTQGYPPADS